MTIAALAWAAAAASAVGAATTAAAQSNAASYNGQLAQQNALAAQQQGDAALAQQQRASEQRMGAAVAAYGAGGVMADTGSPTDVLADSARQAALDKLNTRYSYQMKGLGYQDQATLDSSAAQNAMTGGAISATSAMLSGAAASKYYGKSSTSPNFYGGYDFVPGLGNP